MSTRLRIVQYWLDRALLDLPKFENLPGSYVSIDAGAIPRNGLKSEGKSNVYHVSLGILPYKNYVGSLISVLVPNSKDQIVTANEKECIYLASFDVDADGIPIANSAEIHPSLTIFKAHDIDGDFHNLKFYFEKARTDFRNKLDISKPLSSSKMQSLIDWMQGFMPLGCILKSEFSFTLPPIVNPSWILELLDFTSPRLNLKDSLKKYIGYLQGQYTIPWPEYFISDKDVGYTGGLGPRNYQKPSWYANSVDIFPKDNKAILDHAKRIIMRIKGSEYFLLNLDKESKLNAVLELAAMYLVKYAESLPNRRDFSSKFSVENDFRPICQFSVGMVVFSDNPVWLNELEVLINNPPSADNDSVLNYSIATKDIESSSSFLTETANNVKEEDLAQTLLFDSLDNALRLKDEVVERASFLDSIRSFYVNFERAIDLEGLIRRKLEELEASKPCPEKLNAMEKDFKRLEEELVVLQNEEHFLLEKQEKFRRSDERLTYTEVEQLQDSIVKVIGNRKEMELDIANALKEVETARTRRYMTINWERDNLLKELPDEIFLSHMRGLENDFDKDLIATYGINKNSTPDDFKRIITKLMEDLQQLSHPWVIPSIRALCAFLKLKASKYLEFLNRYKELTGLVQYTDQNYKDLLNLHKHLFMINPIRLFSFKQGAALLEEIEGGKLQLAIVDCSTPPDQLFLAHLHQRFNSVVLLNSNPENHGQGNVPDEIKAALRVKHRLEKVPVYI